MSDYGYSSELPADDDRQALWAQQREERGFDNTELWNLDVSIARFIRPRLIAFKKTCQSHPASLDEASWTAAIDSMIEAFDLYAQGTLMHSTENQAKIDVGLQNFQKYFQHLWN